MESALASTSVTEVPEVPPKFPWERFRDESNYADYEFLEPFVKDMEKGYIPTVHLWHMSHDTELIKITNVDEHFLRSLLFTAIDYTNDERLDEAFIMVGNFFVDTVRIHLDNPKYWKEQFSEEVKPATPERPEFVWDGFYDLVFTDEDYAEKIECLINDAEDGKICWPDDMDMRTPPVNELVYFSEADLIGIADIVCSAENNPKTDEAARFYFEYLGKLIEHHFKYPNYWANIFDNME